jgi:trimeric autotransporter adhesin
MQTIYATGVKSPEKIYILFLALVLIFSVSTGRIFAQDFEPQLGIGHQAGTGPGLNDGFSNFGAFIPLHSLGHDLLIFNDSQLQLYNDQSKLLGANVGVGVRKYDARLNRIFGANVYYDLRPLPDIPSGESDFHQVGFGLESLGEIFDFRVFGNMPTNQDRHSFQTIPNATPQFGGANGQNIVYGYERFRQALGTLDLEGGSLLFARNSYAISAYGGAYHLSGSNVSEWGARGRLELRANDKLFVNGFLQTDPIFDTTGGVAMELRFGRAGSRPNSNYYFPSRLADPVQRRRYISIYETEQELLHTIAGRAITVRHVNSNATSGGDGSIGNPNNNLAAASNQSDDIVYLHGGSLFDDQQIVISSQGQRLLGEGVPHWVNSDQSTFLLPGVNLSGTTPLIQNSFSSPAVTIGANNVEVSGVAVSSSQAGIYGDGINGVDINRNELNQNVTGIWLKNIAGTGSIRQNTANNNLARGVSVEGNFAGDIVDNIANNNLDESGIRIEGNFNGILAGNTTNENSLWGIVVFGSVDADIVGNTAVSNSEGIRLISAVEGDILNNTASNNSNGGFVFQNVIGDIANNLAEENGLGINVLGDVTGNVYNNQLRNNDHMGLLFQRTVTGDIANNSATGNGNYGIVSNRVVGDITGNNVNSNGGGLFVGLSIGDITDNTASNNTRFGGIQIRDHQGILARNTANDNFYWGVWVIGTQVGDVENNIANNNDYAGLNSFGFHGISFENTVIGNLTSNEANGNFRRGINLVGGIQGNVVNNVANNNGDEGIRILQNVAGSFLGNTTNLNLGTGTWISGNISQNFINNTANNNGGNGLQVDGTISGASSPNSASGNAGIDYDY